jgi:SnoaL-like domain
VQGDIEHLRHLYDCFNAREIASLLAVVHADVLWANGMEGGYVQGREQLRGYWTRQWAAIDPHVLPVSFATGPEGEIVVEVHQTVRSLDGNVLSDKTVGHVFHIEDGCVRRFDIRPC